MSNNQFNMFNNQFLMSNNQFNMSLNQLALLILDNQYKLYQLPLELLDQELKMDNNNNHDYKINDDLIIFINFEKLISL
jgi:hypothetical protein